MIKEFDKGMLLATFLIVGGYFFVKKVNKIRENKKEWEK